MALCASTSGLIAAIQLIDAVEGAVAQLGVHPLIHQAHGLLDQSFVLGLAAAGGQHHHAVVTGERRVRAVQIRLIGVRLGHRRLQAVRYDPRRHPTDIVQGAHAGSNQVFLLLRLDCLKIAEMTGSQHRHEGLHLPTDGAVRLADRQFLAGKVHKQLVADFVLDMHRHLVAVTPHLKVVAELRVAVPVRLFLTVLLPELLDRHPDPLQFPCAALKPSAQRTVASVRCPTPGKQLHELAVADSLDLRVAEPGRRKVPCVLAHHRMRYPQGTTDLSIAEPFFPQTNNVSDLAHADPLVGHGFSFPAAAGNQKPAR